MTQSSVHPAYRGVRALVLGATGFIGRHVVAALADSGAEVHCQRRDPSNSADAPVEAVGPGSVHLADLSALGDLDRLLGEVVPDVVFNLAGYGVDPRERDESLALRLNAEIVEQVALALPVPAPSAWAGQRFIHVGSALEYGTVTGALLEAGPCAPTTSYGRSKLHGTLALQRRSRERGLRALTARLFMVYGPGEHAGRLLPALLAAAGGQEPIPLSPGTQARDFTFVADVVAGLLRLGAAAAEPGTVVNLATGRLTTVRVFVEAAAALIGIPPTRLDFGALPLRAEEMVHDPVDVGRMARLLSWQPSTDIVEGLRLTLQSLRPR